MLHSGQAARNRAVRKYASSGVAGIGEGGDRVSPAPGSASPARPFGFFGLGSPAQKAPRADPPAARGPPAARRRRGEAP